MNNSGSPITIDVDLTNPGQFLACCGLFELASRLDPETVAWFDGSTFNVDCCGGSVLEQFLYCNVQPIGSVKTPLKKPNGKPEESPPVWIDSPFNLLLDWWDDEVATQAGFKTWSAGQTVLGFIDGGSKAKGAGARRTPGMRQHVERHLSTGRQLFQSVTAINDPMPFNFDSRLSRNNAIDLGFAGKSCFAFSPAVELLSLVGLQRFRPRVITRWKRNTFCTWSSPLPVTIAAAVTYGMIGPLIMSTYWFPVVPRDAKRRYKLFGPATLERSTHDRSVEQI